MKSGLNDLDWTWALFFILQYANRDTWWNPSCSWQYTLVAYSEKSGSKVGLFLVFLLLAVVVGAAVAGYGFYKYRLRVSLDILIMTTLSILVNINYYVLSCPNQLNFNCLHYIFQSYMDSEIMSIMSQYMPLDSQNKVEAHTESELLRQGTV